MEFISFHRNIKISLLVLFLIYIAATNVFSQTYNVKYIECEGKVEVNVRVKHDRSGQADDYLQWFNLYYQNPNGSESRIFWWDNDNSGDVSNLNTSFEGNTFYYNRDYQWSSSQVTSSLRFEGNNLWLDIFFFDVPNNDWNNKIKFEMDGFYRRPNIFESNNDFRNLAKESDVEAEGIDSALPTNLNATTGTNCGEISLSWGNPSFNFDCGQSKSFTYIEFRQGNGSWQYLTEVQFPGTMYTHTGLVGNTSYSYRIYHRFKPNEFRSEYTAATSQVSATTIGASNAVSNLQATNDLCDETIQLTWSHNQGGNFQALDYDIYRKEKSLSAWSLIQSNHPSKEFIDSNIAPNLEYEYYVDIRNQCGIVRDGSSNVVEGFAAGIPQNPSHVTTTIDQMNNTITLDWPSSDSPSSIVNGYHIVRTTPGESAVQFTTNANTTTYTDNTIQQCKTYTYEIFTTANCFTDGQGTGATITGTIGLDLTEDISQFTVSKGFFENYVEIKWDVRALSSINQIELERRVLGDNSGFTQIQVFNQNSTELFNDFTAEAGTLYEYRITGLAECNGQQVSTNQLIGIGFRTKSGVVTGKVSYTGGIAVSDVKIVADSPSGIVPVAVSLNGNTSQMTVAHNTSFGNAGANNDHLLIETWYKPNGDAFAKDFMICKKEDAYELFFQKSDSTFIFKIEDSSNNTQQVTHSIKTFLQTSPDQIPTWKHIGAMIKDNKLHIIQDGITLPGQDAGNTILNTASTQDLIIGSGFHGKMREFRLWNTAKDSTQLFQDHSRYMLGTEQDLKIHLPLTEPNGQFAYDRSKTANTFNENHAILTDINRSFNDIPDRSLLGYVAYTNSTGDYNMTLPYSASGTTYNITPIYLTHTFDPSLRAVFVGDGATVSNNIDFEDISSFPVTGTAFFKGTSCPVANALLKIDGEFVIQSGEAVMTADDGTFNIDVPIGDHFISIEKPAHTFETGRWPETGTFDFQAPVTNIAFQDSTLITVTGRVVGGTREILKDPGLGLSKNNIGVAEINFKSQQGNGCVDTTLITDTQTGEYTVQLPPLKYEPSVSIQNNATIDFGVLDLIDITNPASLQSTTVTDSTSTPPNTFTYQKKIDYVYRVDPIIDVKNARGDEMFIGDSILVYPDLNQSASEIAANDNRDSLDIKNNSPLPFPVFTGRHAAKHDTTYTAAIRIFELYTNFDNPANIVTDSVPSVDGRLEINNQLAEISVATLELNRLNAEKLDTLQYKFRLGQGNLTQNTAIPEYSYTKTMQIDLVKPNGDVISWAPITGPIPVGGDRLYRAYVLTPKHDGQRFITKGPQKVEYILRDPPGTASNSVREQGTGSVNSKSWSWALGGKASISDVIYSGTKFLAGTGIAIENDIQSTTNFGFAVKLGGGNSGKFTETISNTDRWATNGLDLAILNPDDDGDLTPGADGDVFIGASQNLEFGISEMIEIVPYTNCDQMNCEGDTITSNFRAARTYSLAMQPAGYETGFIFTQKHIKLTLLPDLKELRNTILQTNAKYTSNVAVTDSLYGSSNDDPRWQGRNMNNQSCFQQQSENGSVSFATLTGCSYTYNAINEQDSLTGDSVRIINNQILLWEKALRDNEWEKVNISNQTVIDSLKQVELDKLEAEYDDDISSANANGITLAIIGGGGVGASIPIVAALTGTGVTFPGLTSAAVGYATFAIAAGGSIASAEVTNDLVEYLNKKEKINQKFASLQAINRTISSGVEFTNTVSQTKATSETGKFEFGLSTELRNKTKGTINNNGVEIQRAIELDFNTSREWSSEENETNTVKYTLLDGDLGDFFSVDVYPSMLGYGPIFKRRAGGQTSCPYEPEIRTQFYKPGTIISEGTGQVDKPTISASPINQTNIPADQAAVYTLTMANEGVSDLVRVYTVEANSVSNPFGAIVKIDGFSSTEVRVGPNTSVVKTLTIEKGPGSVFEYDSIEIRIFPDCQKKLFQSVFLTAHFIPTCSDVSIANPENQWVLNTNFKDTMPVDLIDYNINTEDLQRIRLDYKPSEQAAWIGLQSFWKDTTGMNDPMAIPIPTGVPFTHYDWNVASLPDGAYDLRAVAICDNAEKTSNVHSGYMDRFTPRAFGSPSPADGILDPDDDIILRMNEPVDIGSITSLNFDIRGVLNGAPLRHETSMAFDGANDAATIPEYQLQKRDLSVEFWVRRDGTGAATILSQGNQNDELYIGFNAANRIVFRIGNQSLTSDASITDDDWYHVALIYDHDDRTAQIILANANQNFANPDAINTNFITEYGSTGMISIGKDLVSTRPMFSGFIHDLRLWSQPRTESEIAASRNVVLSGREEGIIGYWPMDEAYGTTAFDKVRGRHAQLQNASWSVLPQNHAIQLSNMDTLSANGAATLAFGADADLTLEAWFKTSATTDQSILSNGVGDLENPNSWDMRISDQGQIQIQNNNQSLVTDVGTTYNDNNWHHVAIVIERTKSTIIYIDGQPVTVGNADLFQGFSGPRLWIGTRGSLNGSVIQTDQHFDGALDEIRIWNTARDPEQIARDFNIQLNGDELGLQAYYPFDGVTEAAGVLIRNTSLEDLSENTFDLSYGGSNPAFTVQAPTIRLPRLVENVNFNYSVNNDEIFIQITDPPFRTENVTIDLTVDGLKDLAGNTMASPETWITFMDQNQVFWETEYLSFEKQFNDALSFTAVVKNTGGSAEVFTIQNIPSWLTVSPSSASIAPNSTREIQLTVDPSLAIGRYEHDLFVRTNSFGYNERLLLDLNVFSPPPDWTLEDSQFETNMNIIGQLEINNVISNDIRDMVSVWMNDELRGVAQVELDGTSGKYLVFLTVNSDNIDSGSTIKFKAWDASEGRILTDLTPTNLSFAPNELIGSRSNPTVIQSVDQIELQYELATGWNWISFPLFSDSLDQIDYILKDLNPTQNDQLKTLGNQTVYTSNSWENGALSGLDTDKAYKLKLANQDTFSYSGIFNDPTADPIVLNAGWNWISVKSLTNIDLVSALSSLNPQDGDLIKGQFGFAIYEDGFGWGGNLTTLEPLKGYMLNYASGGTLTFPASGVSNRNSGDNKRDEILVMEKVFGFESARYSENMSLTAVIESCIIDDTGEPIDMAEWFLAAFVGHEYRGAAKASFVPAAETYRYFLTIEGTGIEDLHFALIHDRNYSMVALPDAMTYVSNQVIGRSSQPYVFQCQSAEPCPDEMTIDQVDLTLDPETILYSAKQKMIMKAILPHTRSYVIQAGEVVELLSHFETQIGSNVEINIESCDDESNE